MTAPHREDFAAWLNDPVTRWVLQGFSAAAETQKAAWAETSWSSGMASQGALSELRTRADAYLAIADVQYEQICDQLGEKPRDE